MFRQIRLLLALLTGVMMVGWVYLISLMKLEHVWGDTPTERVQHAVYALPFAWLLYNLATCRWPNRALCAVGLAVNLPAVVVAISWFSEKGIVPGYVLLFYLFVWYGYAAKVLQQKGPHATSAPFHR